MTVTQGRNPDSGCEGCERRLPERFCFVDIQGGPSYPALFQGLGQRFFINQAAS